MRKLLLVWAFLIALIQVCPADTYNFTSLDVKNGLPDSFIHEILRDSHGFIWIYSGDVLSRYDGYEFRGYPIKVTEGPDDYMLKEDKWGNIIFRSNSDCFIYDRNQDTMSTDLAANEIYSELADGFMFMDIDYDGNLWYAIEEGRVVCMTDVDSIIEFLLPDDAYIRNLEHRGEDVYVQSMDGRVLKASFSSDSSFEYITEVPFYEGLYQRMFLDIDGRLWFYVPHSSGFSLKTYSTVTERFVNLSLPDGKPLYFVTDVVDDGKGNIWISTDNNGIMVYEKASGTVSGLVSRPDDRYSLPSDHINSLYIDFQDVMWVGTSKRGIAYTCLNSTSFKRISYPELNDVNCILEDSKGSIWYGTDGKGVFMETAHSASCRNFNTSSCDIPGDLIVCSYEDTKGRIWFGSFGNGVFYHHDGRFTQILHPDPATNALMKYVRTVDEDVYGNIWVGTIACGLFCIQESGDILSFNVENSVFSTNAVTGLYCNRGRYLYVALSNSILIADTSVMKFSELELPEPYSDELKEITCIYKDSRGLLWIGGSGGVLVINEDSSEYVLLNGSNGLSHDMTRGICEDKYHNMWITADIGVTHAVVVNDPAEPMPKFRCYRYYDQDGLDGIMFNMHSLACTDDGSIMIGGIGGVVKTEPQFMPYVPAWNNIEYTGLYIGGSRVKAGEKIDGKIILDTDIQTKDRLEIGHSCNSFSITVSSLNFPVLHKSRMAYRLDGHTDWISMDGNMITFNNLQPDTYHLQVMTTDSGFDAGYVKSMTISVRPPLWRSAGAYIIYVALLLLLFSFVVIRIRQKTRLKYKLRILEMNISRQQEIDEAHMRFFTNISHDLRTPLSLIITPLERLLSKNDLEPKLEDDLRHIHHNAEILMGEINNLLEFRKIDASVGSLNESYGNLTEVVKEVCNSFRPYSIEKKIRLDVRLDEDRIEMSFDKDKVRRILINLLSNAYKFNKENGSVSVRLSKTRKEDGMEAACIEVSDTGTGIPDSVKPKIFDRFYQGAALTDNIGSGIGLNMVKEYVSMHGGSVTVRDNVPCGSIFTVLLPSSGAVLQDLSDHTGQPDILPESEDTAHILVVEDNDDFRKFIVDCIKDRYPVLEASDGKEAMRVLETSSVMMVISDVMMPNMDGLELCRTIKGDLRYSHIPVILLTAKTADDNIIEGLREGSDDYITKPFNLEILLLRIETLLKWSEGNHSRFNTMDVSPSEITITSLDEQLITKAIRLVEENISDVDFSVDELSASIGMTRGHLYKKLMAITGKSPLEFIRTIRLKRGRQYLEKSQLGIADIAYKVGLSPKQFSRCFKEAFGELPSEYKKRFTSVQSPQYPEDEVQP